MPSNKGYETWGPNVANYCNRRPAKHGDLPSTAITAIDDLPSTAICCPILKRIFIRLSNSQYFTVYAWGNTPVKRNSLVQNENVDDLHSMRV